MKEEREDKDKRLLIIKFLTEEISDVELDILKTWLATDKVNRRIFDEENMIWHESGLRTKSEHFQPDRAWLEISSKLGIGKKMKAPIIILNKNHFRLLIAAATIFFIVAIGGLVDRLTEKDTSAPFTSVTSIVRTEEGDKAHLLLSDSTLVTLNSGTAVEYSSDYNSLERRIKLSGEAFFDVNTDPSKPFIVQLEKMSITATGTRFNVLSYNNEDRIETTLEEGSVKVAIEGRDTIQVRPGQQVVFFTKTNSMILRDVSTDTYTSWTENKLRFNDTPMEETFRRIARRYNVVFEIRNSNLLEMKYTATFIDESIDEVMQMLATVTPIKYKIINRTSVNDKKYLKPKVIVGKRKL